VFEFDRGIFWGGQSGVLLLRWVGMLGVGVELAMV